MKATDMFTYNLVHCPGAENTATATALLCTIVRSLRLFFCPAMDCFGNLRMISPILVILILKSRQLVVLG